MVLSSTDSILAVASDTRRCPVTGHRCRALADVSHHEACWGSVLFVLTAAVVLPLSTDAFPRTARMRATSAASREKSLERRYCEAHRRREAADRAERDAVGLRGADYRLRNQVVL
jgi:hypothetical protein